MTKLTLPIEYGKQYVRRDGKVVTARHGQSQGSLAFIGDDDEVGEHYVYRDTGYVNGSHSPNDFDLISDYIKGTSHGHEHSPSSSHRR